MRNSQHTEKKLNSRTNQVNRTGYVIWTIRITTLALLSFCKANYATKKLVKDKQVSFNCLDNHRSTDCTSGRRCIIENSGGKHHSTLHRNQDKTVQRHPTTSICSYVLKCIADTLQCKPSRTVVISIYGAFNEDTVSSNLVQLHYKTYFYYGYSTISLLG